MIKYHNVIRSENNSLRCGYSNLKLKITFCNPEFEELDDFQGNPRKVTLKIDRTTDDGRKVGKQKSKSRKLTKTSKTMKKLKN